MSIISSPRNSCKMSSGVGSVYLKLLGRRNWNGLGGLVRGRALKLGLDGTTALCLISACNSWSWHSLAVKFSGSLA